MEERGEKPPEVVWLTPRTSPRTGTVAEAVQQQDMDRRTQVRFTPRTSPRTGTAEAVQQQEMDRRTVGRFDKLHQRVKKRCIVGICQWHCWGLFCTKKGGSGDSVFKDAYVTEQFWKPWCGEPMSEEDGCTNGDKRVPAVFQCEQAVFHLYYFFPPTSCLLLGLAQILCAVDLVVGPCLVNGADCCLTSCCGNAICEQRVFSERHWSLWCSRRCWPEGTQLPKRFKRLHDRCIIGCCQWNNMGLEYSSTSESRGFRDQPVTEQFWKPLCGEPRGSHIGLPMFAPSFDNEDFFWTWCYCFPGFVIGLAQILCAVDLVVGPCLVNGADCCLTSCCRSAICDQRLFSERHWSLWCCIWLLTDGQNPVLSI